MNEDNHDDAADDAAPMDAPHAPEPATPPTAAAEDDAEGVSVRFYADAKHLEPWQVAALLPHIRAHVAEHELGAAHDELGRVLPVETLDALTKRALTERA
jgi:hypothetical protein